MWRQMCVMCGAVVEGPTTMEGQAGCVESLAVRRQCFSWVEMAILSRAVVEVREE